MGDEGSLGHISKGPVHTRIDAYANSNQRQSFLTALQSTRDYLDILENDAGVNPRYIQYLRRTWYSQGANGWWPWLQPIQPLVRQGLIQAIDLASRDPDTGAARTLPIDSYWMPGVNQVATLIAVSAQQVTRLLLTPESPPPTRNRSTRVPIWVVKNSGPQTVGNQTLEEIVVAVQGNIATWRRKEFS
jgi:hypothetical protein